MPQFPGITRSSPRVGVPVMDATAATVAASASALEVDSYFNGLDLPDRPTPFRDVSELLEGRAAPEWRNGAELAEALMRELEETPGARFEELLHRSVGFGFVGGIHPRQVLARMGVAGLPLLLQSPSGLESAVRFWQVTPADVDRIVQGVARTGLRAVYLKVVNALLCNPYVSEDLKRALLLSTVDLSTNERGELAVHPLESVEPLGLARALAESRDSSRRLLLAEALTTQSLGLGELPTEERAALIDRLVHDEALTVRVAMSARFWESSDPSPEALRRLLEPVDNPTKKYSAWIPLILMQGWSGERRKPWSVDDFLLRVWSGEKCDPREELLGRLFQNAPPTADLTVLLEFLARSPKLSRVGALAAARVVESQVLTPAQQASALEVLSRTYEGAFDSTLLAFAWRHPELSALMPNALSSLAFQRYQPGSRVLPPELVSAWRESMSSVEGLRAAFREGYLEGSSIFFAPCFVEEDPVLARDLALGQLRGIFERPRPDSQTSAALIERAIELGVPPAELLAFARQLFAPEGSPPRQGPGVHVLQRLLGSSELPPEELESCLTQLVGFVAKFYVDVGSVSSEDFEAIIRRLCDVRLTVEAQERLLALLFEKGTPEALWHASHVLMEEGLSRVALAQLGATAPKTYLDVIPAVSDALVPVGTGELPPHATRVEMALARRPSVDEAAFERGVRRFLKADPATYKSQLVTRGRVRERPSSRPKAQELLEEPNPSLAQAEDLIVADGLIEAPASALAAFFGRLGADNPARVAQLVFAADVIRGVKFDELKSKYSATASLDWVGADRAHSRGEDAALECLLEENSADWDGLLLLAAARTQSLTESARQRLLNGAQTPEVWAAVWAWSGASLDFAGRGLERRLAEWDGYTPQEVLAQMEPVLMDSRLSPAWVRSLLLTATDMFIGDKRNAHLTGELVALIARVLSARTELPEDDRAVLRTAADEAMNRLVFGTPVGQARYDQVRADWPARAAKAEFTQPMPGLTPAFFANFPAFEKGTGPSGRYDVCLSEDAGQWSSPTHYRVWARDTVQLATETYELPPFKAPPSFRPFGAE